MQPSRPPALQIAFAETHGEVVLQQVVFGRRLATKRNQENTQRVVQFAAGAKVAVCLSSLQDACVPRLVARHADVVGQPRGELGGVCN